MPPICGKPCRLKKIYKNNKIKKILAVQEAWQGRMEICEYTRWWEEGEKLEKSRKFRKETCTKPDGGENGVQQDSLQFSTDLEKELC
jgi:hypothetical protein